MRGEYAAIHTAIADDADFKRLSPHGKTCWFILRMLLGASGIDLVRSSLSVVGDLTGLEGGDLRAALQELVDGGWLYANGDVLWLRNVLRYNPNMSLQNEKHVKAITRHLAGLPKCPLVNAFADYYGLPKPFPDSPSDRVSDAYAIQDYGQRTPDDGHPASANADEGEPSAEITFGDVMAVVRAELHLGCNDNETRRSGSCLSRDFAGKVAPEDVIDACRGTRKLIEAGLVDRVKPGETVGLRFLRSWKYGNRYLWDAALEAERLGVGLTPTAPKAKRSEPDRLRVDVPGAA